MRGTPRLIRRACGVLAAAGSVLCVVALAAMPGDGVDVVTNPTPETPTVTAAGTDAMTVVLDEEGLRPGAAPFAAERSLIERSPAAAELRDDGTGMLVLAGRHASLSVARLDADGNVVQDCVDHVDGHVHAGAEEHGHDR